MEKIRSLPAEVRHLERAARRLRNLRDGLNNAADRTAIDIGIEHIESRLIDMRAKNDD
jgi:hypothetical protein